MIKISSLIEAGLIVATVLVIYLSRPGWPESIALGRMVLSLSVVFLVQTLLRDLWLLWQNRHTLDAGSEPRMVFCVESTIGIGVVVIGCLMVLLPGSQALSPGHAQWCITLAIVLFTGLLLKDFVIAFGPFRIYRDPDHINLVVGFGSKR